ncbi:maleylpyruvate isomerase family mycothiol-dependent enzyme [Kitasatospora sp. HPMI-4]|uniref:maleylpyruvate isomerase family mycothiol-dependent enzyme n=1 Tax=Kitasatospora sp. HPMI-4 TaxID=3448443 RepID=UPI003F1BA075
MRSIIEEVAHSGARFTAGLAELTDEEVTAPSALPGWTRGHVITHVARSIDAYLWLLAVAATGAEPAPRTGAEELARAVREGAGRSAAELAADVRSRLGLLAEAAEAMPAERWETQVTALAGWRHPAWYTLRRCLRELETHHVDLDIGYRTADWPGPYVTWALDDTLAALAARGFPLSRVEAVDLGRSWTLAPSGPVVTGPGHAVLGWLSGRTTQAPLTAGRPLPDPPGWPLPPAPGWD